MSSRRKLDSVEDMTSSSTKKIESYVFLFHSTSFSERGDSVTLLALGCAIIKRLNARIFIALPKGTLTVSKERVRFAESLGFVFLWYENKAELDSFARENAVTHTYVFSGGRRLDLPYYDKSDPESFRIADSFHITHAVFRNFDPHGDVYAYVSQWLFEASKKRFYFSYLFFRFRNRRNLSTKVLAWPHFIDWPPTNNSTTSDFRKIHNISENSVVIGRIGGFSEFSDPVAQKAIVRLLNIRTDIVCVFINTKPFLDHPRMLYLPPLERNLVKDFYEACDILINGRRMGESFGYSIVEPLSLGKPVIAPHWIRNIFMDKNHVRLLKKSGTLYRSQKHLERIVEKISNGSYSSEHWKSLASEYDSEKAMETLFMYLEGPPGAN